MKDKPTSQRCGATSLSLSSVRKGTKELGDLAESGGAKPCASAPALVSSSVIQFLPR